MARPLRSVSRTSPAQLYVREWRTLRAFTQEELAERAHLSVASISQLETDSQGYRGDTLLALSSALGCQVVDLFHDPNSPNYQAWIMFRDMGPAVARQAVRIIKALLG